MTKTYASTLLMQLVEQGELDLDDPVSMYGIELESRGTISVRHLASHTSEGKPGFRYRYNGDRYSLLDRVIEEKTGQCPALPSGEIIFTNVRIPGAAGMIE